MAYEIPAIQPVNASSVAPQTTPYAGGERRGGGVPEQPSYGLAYEVNQDTGKVIIKVVNKATNEIIREIPSEEIQRMSRALEEVLGRLYDQRG
jgi:hypothetical protein